MIKLLIVLFLVTACDTMDKKMGYSQAAFTFKIHEPIVSLSPQAVEVGKELTIKGRQFQQEMQVLVNGKPSEYTFVNPANGDTRLLSANRGGTGATAQVICVK